jgi:hypothetical protein
MPKKHHLKKHDTKARRWSRSSSKNWLEKNRSLHNLRQRQRDTVSGLLIRRQLEKRYPPTLLEAIERWVPILELLEPQGVDDGKDEGSI